MRKMLLPAAALVLAATLAACAPRAKDAAPKVKCPACGYQFEVPPHGR